MELKIVILLLTIHYIGFLITKTKAQVLSCGIFGWAGKSAKQFDKAKFDIQGLYNNSRGGDSCGVTTDGEIYYGVTTFKHYGDFIAESSYDKPEKMPVVIGHTRKSSSGAINGDNAHPFGFGGTKDAFEFIGVHNGTLHNKEELARTFGIETSVYNKVYSQDGLEEKQVFSRIKIDSEVLLESIYKNKNFKVLSDYIGGAALLFTNTNEPNVVYAYKGASRMDKNGLVKQVEERPLFYYKESKNSLYMSSMEESLMAIGGEANINLFQFDENFVYKITDGDIDKAEKFEISRINAHQRPAPYTYGAYNRDACGFETAKKSSSLFDDSDYVAKTSRKGNEDGDGIQNIRDEKISRFFKSPIYMNKLRYYRNGHLIDGVYTWIDKYGFRFLSLDINKAKEDANLAIDRPFDLESGDFSLANIPNRNESSIIYPFTTVSKLKPPIIYFHNGVMLETELDYIAVRNKAKQFNFLDYSEMSKHPVINVDSKLATKADQCIMYRSEKFTGNINPLGSNKIYYIENGNLTKEKIIDATLGVEKSEFSQKLLPIATGADILTQNDDKLLEKKFTDFLNGNQVAGSEADLTDVPLTNESGIEDDFAVELVDKHMIDIYISVQSAVDELHPFSAHPYIKSVIETNEDYLMSLDEVILNSCK